MPPASRRRATSSCATTAAAAGRGEADAAPRAPRRRRGAARATGRAIRSRSSRRTATSYGRGTDRRQGDGVDLRREPAAARSRKASCPSRDIILALTADEESGDANGAEWLVKEHRDAHRRRVRDQRGRRRHADAGWASHSSSSCRRRRRCTPTSRSTATNPGGHSSVPRPDNAIYQLADGARRARALQLSRRAESRSTRAFFEQTAKVETPEIAAAMRAIVANPNDCGRGRATLSQRRRATTRCCARRASRRGSPAATRTTRCRRRRRRT